MTSNKQRLSVVTKQVDKFRQAMIDFDIKLVANGYPSNIHPRLSLGIIGARPQADRRRLVCGKYGPCN